MPTKGSSSKRAVAPEPLVADGAEPPIPRETLPIVATAFAAGLMLGTRPGRHLVRGALRAGLMLVKPALVVGGLLKLREFSHRPLPSPTPSNHED